jgi:hypothetical protein
VAPAPALTVLAARRLARQVAPQLMDHLARLRLPLDMLLTPHLLSAFTYQVAVAAQPPPPGLG